MIRLTLERFRAGTGARRYRHGERAWKQQNIAGFQLQRPATDGIVQQRRSADNSVIRNFADLGWPLLNAPGRAIEAAQIDPVAPASSRKIG
jgi:hypothetical protein